MTIVLMNLWLQFPKGTASVLAVPQAEFVKKMQQLQAAGLVLIQRGDDEYEVIGLTSQNWRHGTALIRRLFPQATRYQKV